MFIPKITLLLRNLVPMKKRTMQEKLQLIAHKNGLKWRINYYDESEMVVIHNGNNLSSEIMDELIAVCWNHSFSIMSKELELWICINER